MPSIHQILKQYWGFDSFRQPQEEIINSVLNGKDTLALLPTGGGKSVCFQVPALAKDGLCLVVSPLIALMKDQVMNLNKKGIKAAAVYTGQTHRQMDTLLDNCVYGNYKFLYISPERLATDDFKMRLQKMNVSLLAVDEAHCISQWGYDFRPPYLRIAEIRTLLKNVPVIALTATATPEVAVDIQVKLQFGEKNVFSKSFVRHNLSYVVRQTMDKQRSLAEILNKVNGSAVVYVRNRKKTREIAEQLSKQGISADYYHAGLDTKERTQKQDNWTQNRTRVIVSTNAFGMGIDKPDVRTVVHIDVPETIEAYFQEAGRAGRDEQKAYAVQLLDSSDVFELDTKIKESYPTVDFIRDVYEAVCSYLRIAYEETPFESFDFDIGDFALKNKWKPARVLSALKTLQQQEFLYLSEGMMQQSQITATANKDVIYKFQQDNKSLEPLVKLILRSSEGVFEDYVPVDEQILATRLNQPIAETIRQLNMLDKFKIFRYKPRKDKPQIFLLKPRAKRENLRLDTAAINERKNEYERRLKAIKYYITENNICRTRLLVNYFGEANDTDCGICDVCIAKKKSGLNNADFSKIVTSVETELKNAPLAINQLSAKLNIETSELTTVIDFLMGAGKIARTAKNELLWKE